MIRKDVLGGWQCPIVVLAGRASARCAGRHEDRTMATNPYLSWKSEILRSARTHGSRHSPNAFSQSRSRYGHRFGLVRQGARSGRVRLSLNTGSLKSWESDLRKLNYHFNYYPLDHRHEPMTYPSDTYETFQLEEIGLSAWQRHLADANYDAAFPYGDQASAGSHPAVEEIASYQCESDVWFDL